MKNILIVAAPTTSAHLSACNIIEREIRQKGIPLERPIDTTFLLSGPRSFEASIMIHGIAKIDNLPLAVFEIESCLMLPENNQG